MANSIPEIFFFIWHKIIFWIFSRKPIDNADIYGIMMA